MGMKESIARHIWLRGIIAGVIIPVGILLLAESTLRITGYGYDPSAIIPCQVQGRKAYHGNCRFSWRFFPGYIARDFPPFLFPETKSDNTFRIFVVGASAARGEPATEYSFWRMIQVLLDERYPEVSFEVIPVAMAAINSHVCREIVDECIGYAPDLFIVYLGNNEVVGPYGAGTVFSPLQKNLTLIRLATRIKATRLAQLSTDIIHSLRSESAIRVWKGMEMFLDRPVRADDPSLGFAYEHFRKNLEVIRDSARRSGSQIIFCTVATNLKDNPPFASAHKLGLAEREVERFRELYLQGRQLEERGHYVKALAKYLRAAHIDSSYAELQFSMGHCYWQTGDYEKAKRKFALARDLDVQRFRADTEINNTIRLVAGGNRDDSVHLLEGQGLLNAVSPHGIAGNELFLDHVHMNFAGNYVLAEGICKEIEGLLPGDSSSEKTRKRWSSVSECQRRLGYTDWNQYSILMTVVNGFLKRPPFTNQLGHDQRMRQMDLRIQQLQTALTPRALQAILEQHTRVISEYPNDLFLRMLYADLLVKTLGALKPAMEQYEKVLEIHPCHSDAYGHLGEIQGRLGDIPAAIASNEKALEYSPYNFVALYNLGVAYELQGKPGRAAEYFRNAVLREPFFEHAHNSLGTALANDGKLDEAVEAFQRGLEFTPDSQTLRLNLAVSHIKLGNREEALRQVNAVLRVDPESREALELLNLVGENLR